MIRRNKLTTNRKQYAVYWIVFAFMMIYVVLVLYPYVWAFLSSVSTDSYRENAGKLLPSLVNGIDFSGFQRFFAYEIHTLDGQGVEYVYGFFDLVGNTLFLCVTRTTLSLAFPIMAAYCYTNYRFKGRQFFFFYGVVMTSVPIYGGMSFTYQWMYELNLYDTYIAVWFMAIAPFANFLFYFAFFKGISWNYAEAAFIDGAGHFAVFFRVMLPQLAGIIAVFFVNAFIGAWNDWMTNYLYLPSKPQVAYAIYLVQGEATRVSDYQMFYSAVMIGLIVPLIVFAIFSKKILSTVYTGGLKG